MGPSEKGLTQDGGAGPIFFNAYIYFLLKRLHIVREAMGFKTDLVSAFEDDMKAHTTSLVALGIVALTSKSLRTWLICS